MDVNYVYCPTCEKSVKLKRKNFDHMYHEILCFLVLTGIGIIIYLILKYIKKKNTCPNCESVFDLNNPHSHSSPDPTSTEITAYKSA